MTTEMRLSVPVITGMGVITAIGQGRAAFAEALFSGKTAFGYLQRPGRIGARPFIGAEITEPTSDTPLAGYERLLRTASLSARLALLATLEAWQDAEVATSNVAPARIGLVVGGSNLQQRMQQQSWQHHAEKPEFILPTYGLTFWDTDLVGVLSQALQIQGEGYSVGGASASGSLAMIHAARQIMLGLTDVSLAVGPLCDLSSWECQGLKNLGAMGSDRYADQPQFACRPFDQESDGFIYGEGCGVVVLENAELAQARGKAAYGRLLGWGSNLDGNRNANPNQAGEVSAIRAALQMAGLRVDQIDYVNTHGTGTPLGDKTEVAAIKVSGLSHALLNATKSLTGHCLTAAGVIEAIATLLQMNAGTCHPTRNLEKPIDTSLRWVAQDAVNARLRYALSNGFAFGGINTALLFGSTLS